MRLTRVRLGLESQKRLSEANGRAEVAAVREGRPLPSGQCRAGRVARGSAWQPRRRIHSELWSQAAALRSTLARRMERRGGRQQAAQNGTCVVSQSLIGVRQYTASP